MMNTKATVSTTYFTYDHLNKKIDGTEENFILSGIPGSAQDLALMSCRKAHPDYEYRIVKLKKEKNSYKGLTRELMFDYLEYFGSKDMKVAFNKMKQDGTSYPAMKSWFLDLFPHFTVENARKEIQKYRLGEVKAKYKVVKLHSKITSNNEQLN